MSEPGRHWRQDWIERRRVDHAPPPGITVVAIDPPHMQGEPALCGIVVAMLGADGCAYVLADRSVTVTGPDEWARACHSAFREFNAVRVVAEAGRCRDFVGHILSQCDPSMPVHAVRVTRGKWLRTGPIAVLYAEDRVSHVGRFAALEAEMVTFGIEPRQSFYRLEALVVALTDLMFARYQTPNLRAM